MSGEHAEISVPAERVRQARRSTAVARDRSSFWAIPSSLLAHALLIAVLVTMVPGPWTAPPPERVLVDILTPRQFRSLTAPPEPDTTGTAPASVASPERFRTVPATMPKPPAPAPPAMVRATRILSGAALADPRSRQARLALRQLSRFDRREQLCNLEAMEQIHAWRKDYAPERLVAYAMADTTITGNVVLAEGAAFRSKRQWYHLRFRCEVTPDLENVVAFEFLVGDPIPRAQWAAHHLAERY